MAQPTKTFRATLRWQEEIRPGVFVGYAQDLQVAETAAAGRVRVLDSYPLRRGTYEKVASGEYVWVKD